ncbi:MAG: phosphoglucosamine mutase [Alphaproteobacteria bacterium]
MSVRKLFGTDGVRGHANTWPMTAEVALKIGQATGKMFTRGEHKHRVVIGKDTRLSGYMIEAALMAGFTSAGMDVLLLGPLPTPAVAMLTVSMRADIGVMISASHNPFEDNGIKIFGPNGYKLSDDIELEIEDLIENHLDKTFAPSDKIGQAKRLDDAVGRYIEYVKRSFPSDLRLDGLKIVLDCANGASYKVAPTVLWELGAEVVKVGVNPDGKNINRGCGATAPSFMCEEVVKHGADFGIALDGDADRVIISDENGKVIDGDQILALIANHLQQKNQLKGGAVVATVMSNMGLERFLAEKGLSLVRTAVGDRYVVEEMLKSGYNLGGEQSGHIILSDYATTGDGLMAALQVCAALSGKDRPVSELTNMFAPFPQVLKNIRFETREKASEVLALDNVKKSIAEAEKELADNGRILIRTSGTEPLVRVMTEAEDEQQVNQIANHIVSIISENC